MLKSLQRNNPGNIEKGTNWQGLDKEATAKSSRFCVFVSPEYGIRALYKVLLTYFTKYKLTTISEIVTRYAPPSENQTKEYIHNVSTWSGIPEDSELNLRDKGTAIAIVSAFIRQEVGFQPYTKEQIMQGVQLA